MRPEPGIASGLRERASFRGGVAFGLYLIASLLWFGLPVLGDLDGSVIGVYGIEQSAYIWSLEWWPHAVGEGLELFHPEVIFAPDGSNLAWAAAVPGASALAAPITLAFGGVVSYNIWAILAPALSGWTAYLLCNRVTRRFWPSLAGGYVFAFSSYTVAATIGHLNLMLVAAVPAAAYLFLRHLDGSLSGWRFVVPMVGVLVFQFLTFTETFATMALFAAIAVGAAILLYPERRAELWRSALATGVAYVVAALVVAPYLYYALSEPDSLIHVNLPRNFSTDPVNLVVPTIATAIGGSALDSISLDFHGGPAEQYGYLGLPLLAILAWVALDGRTRRPATLPFAVGGAALIASLGPYLHLGGDITDVPLPWWPLTEAPLFEFALPSRVMLYAWVAVAVAVALFLATPGRRLVRWGLVIVAAVSLSPDLGRSVPAPERSLWRVPDVSLWHADVSTPRFFERGHYREFLGPGETMLVFPYGPLGLSMLWQSQTDMDFAMAGGYISSSPPEEYRCWPIEVFLQFGIRVPNATRELLAFARAKRVAIAVTPRGVYDPLRALLARRGVRPLLRGGMKVYRLPGVGAARAGPRSDCP
jgi:hypothetical protein